MLSTVQHARGKCFRGADEKQVQMRMERRRRRGPQPIQNIQARQVSKSTEEPATAAPATAAPATVEFLASASAAWEQVLEIYRHDLSSGRAFGALVRLAVTASRAAFRKSFSIGLAHCSLSHTGVVINTYSL